MEVAQDENRKVINEIIRYLYDNYVVIKILKQANKVYHGSYSWILDANYLYDFEQDVYSIILKSEKPESIIQAYGQGIKNLYRFVWSIVRRQVFNKYSILNKNYRRFSQLEEITDLNKLEENDDVDCDSCDGCPV